MKITALKYGESVYGENYIFKNGRKDRLLPISFVIYLIRTDDKNILVDVGCDDGAGFVMSIYKRPVDVLRESGLTPEDITDVVITHAHHDHIEAIRYYQNATIHIQRQEYPAAQKYLKQEYKIHLFDDEYEIADRITVKKIGGHTAGSCILLAENYLLCGDECYYQKCLSDQILTGASYDAEKSWQFITEYGNGNYIPLLFHDPNIMQGKIGCVEVV